MKIKDVMYRDIITANRATSLSQLLRKFSKFHNFPVVPVVDKGNRMIGIVNLENIIGLFGAREPEILKTIPYLDEKTEIICESEFPEEVGLLILVEDIMEKNFVYVNENGKIEEAQKQLSLQQVGLLPVLDDNLILVGMLGKFDIIKAVLKGKKIC